MKRPSFQFYPGDWMRDAALQSCSLAAQGLWIKMLCLMHEGSEYGHLKVGDKVVNEPVLARLVGLSTGELQPLLAELIEAKVCSIGRDKCWISRRMVRDERRRQIAATSGILGGNPALLKGKDKQNPTTPVNQKITAAFAVASALDLKHSERPVDKSAREAVGDKSPKPNGTTPKLPAQWWTDDAKTDQVGRLLGVPGIRGEFYPQYRSRLFAEIKRLKTHKE